MWVGELYIFFKLTFYIKIQIDNSSKQFAVVQWLAKKGDQILYDKVEHNSFYDSSTKQAVPLDELKVDENYKVLWKSNKYNAKFIMKGK